MTKRKLTKNEREEVKRVFEDQRAKGRCDISKRLAKEKKELTKEIDAEISKMREELDALEKKRLDILKEHKLVDLDKRTRHSCSSYELHPELEAYDQETRRMTIELLTEETIPVDVKAILTKALEAEA